MMQTLRARLTQGSLETRFRLAAFALAMLLTLIFGGIALFTQITHTQKNQYSYHAATLGLLSNTLRLDLEDRLGALEGLTGNAMLWTAISDSYNRDSYLKPFLDSYNRTNAGLMPISLFDYRGRWIAGESIQFAAGEDAIHALVQKALASQQPEARYVAGSSPRLLLAYPVRYPYTPDVIGVLLGNVSLDAVIRSNLLKLDDSLGYIVRLDDAELFASAPGFKQRCQPVVADLSPHSAPTLFHLEIELFGLESSAQKVFERQGGLFLFTGLALILGIWLISGVLARRLVRRLRTLADAVSAAPQPRAASIPQDDGDDEISLLARALKQALSEHEQMTEQLEELVRARTQELNTSQERYRLVVEGSQDGIWDWDIATGELYVSPRWKEIIGYRDDELSNSFDTFVEHLHPDDKTRVLDFLEAHLHGREPHYRVDFRFRHKDGSWRWIHSRGIVLRNAEGKPYRMAGSHTDVTERRKDEDTLRTLYTAIEQAPATVVIADLDANIEYVNPRFSQITGYSADEALGQNPRILQSGHTRKESYQQMWDSLTHGQVWCGELENKRKNGEFYWEDIQIAPVKNASGEVTHYVAVKIDITPRKRMEQALVESEAMYRALFDNNMYAALMTDPIEGRVLAANQAAQNLLGRSEDELRRMARHEIMDTQDPRLQAVLIERQQSGSFLGELDAIARDGRKIPVELSSVVFTGINGRTLSSMVIRDLTEIKRNEERLRLAANVFTHAHEGIIITDAETRIIDVNATFTQITGYSREDVLGKSPYVLNSGQQDAAFYAAMWRKIQEADFWQGEIWNRRKDGSLYAEWLTISVIRDAQGRLSNYLAIFSDVTEQKEHQRHIEHIAHYDTLTGLPNRVLLADRLKQSMAWALRHEQPLAVAYLDLDGFKAVNDNHGHSTGDKLLAQIANRMKQAVRDGDTVARMGGDEFVAVLQDLHDINSSVPLILRLLAAAAQPVEIGALSLRVSASVGVTYFPQQDEIDADQLLRQADQAMYLAKQAGKNRYHVFDAEQDRSVRGHHEYLTQLQSALARGEFELHYQPKVNMRTGEVVGAEALLRWRHAERGLLAPAAFLGTIENTALAIELGEWVIDTALAQICSWHGLGLHIAVSVNVGARQLQQKDFIPRLRLIMARYPEVRPECLELEVLESNALEDLDQVSKVIEACRELGIHFALDDFGTGYSSLTYLKRLPARTLKIDQSFVHDMLEDTEDLAIVEGVLSLASAFHREVIAEGVETLTHGTMLLRLGCELGQGYGIARPMPASELADWMAHWCPPPEWAHTPRTNREDMHILYAAVEHRAWVSAVVRILQEKSGAALGLAHTECHFGKWLQTEALNNRRFRDRLDEFDALHEAIHVLGAELLDLKAQGRGEEVLARIGELEARSEQLLEQVWALEHGAHKG